MRMLYRHLRLALFLLALTASAPVAWAQDAAADWTIEDDQWYILELAGAKTGWMHSVVSTDGKHYQTVSKTQMSIARGSIELEIRSDTTYLETLDGKLLKVSFLQKMAMQETEQDWIFGDDEVMIVSHQGGRTLTNTKPLPKGDWLTPMEVGRHIESQIAEGNMTIKYSMLSPDAGLEPIDVVMTYSGDDRFETKTESYPVTIWTTRTSAVPMDVTEMYTAEGQPVFSRMTAPFGELVTKLSTEAEAMAKPANAEVPELMLNTFVKPDRPIRRPMRATSSSLRLTSRDGEMPELPSAGAQRVQANPDGAGVILTVDIENNLAASAEDLDNEEYLGASSMIDPTDPMVKKLAARAVKRAGDDTFARAEALRKFANKHISRKGMATAFATASETARTKTGDCSEHGVLLAALLRAEGIPSRVATGLVYVESFAGEENIFGWHMWTQALIDGAWVDFDATLPVRYNAGHVLTGTSSLAEGMGTSDMTPVLMLLGNLDIDVLDVGYGNDDER